MHFETDALCWLLIGFVTVEFITSSISEGKTKMGEGKLGAKDTRPRVIIRQALYYD